METRPDLRAAQAETPDAELEYHADRLNYFDHGKVDRSFVAKDVRRYYQRWRERKFTLVRMRVTAQTATEATVEFRIRYDLNEDGRIGVQRVRWIGRA